MSYYVRLSRAIRQRLRDLPGNTRNIAQNRILSLAEQPRDPQMPKNLKVIPAITASG